MTEKKLRHLIIACILLLTAADLSSQNIEVTVTGIRSGRGQIAIGVFTDQESYMKNEAFLEIQFPKKEIKDGAMTVSFTLEPGTYGLCLLDDEDNNRLMHYNFLGMPKEGFGFSDYYHTGLTKPSFGTFKFDLVNGQKKIIEIRVRYIL